MKFTPILLFLAQGALAGPLALPPQPQPEYTQNVGAQLPLEVTVRDEDDRAVPLSSYFGTRPVVMVLGYYRCPNLCATLMQATLQTLAALPTHTAYDVVAVSIDPRDIATLAAQRKAAYGAVDGVLRLHLLRADSASIARIASATGFHYVYDRALDQYVHPAGLLVASPEGRITRYFLGIAPDARDLRLALVEAAEGRTGTLADRLQLLCSHYDPATGRYSVPIMNVVRTVCVLLLAVLAVWLWRRRGGGPA